MKVHILNQIKECPIGTRVIDLIDPSISHNYLICKINDSYRELNHRLKEKYDGATIKLYGLEDIEGGHAYEATLRFIIAKAFYEIDNNIKIRFSYNASRSIFCEILNTKYKMNHYADDVIKKVKEIIDKDITIVSHKISQEELINHYKDEQFIDKIDIVKSLKRDITKIYECDGYWDFLYNYMVPSTGYIKNYIIRPYSPGLIIQYPRYELNQEIPQFIEESKYGKTLRQAYKWGKDTNNDTIYGLNKKVSSNNIVDFIQTCEAKHNNMLAELGELINKDKENIRLICIAGPSSSGKTTFCNRLRIELMSKGINPVMISMDNYYLPKDEISKIQNKPIDELDLEDINCLDIELFNKHLFELINGDEVVLPVYDFKERKHTKGKPIKVSEGSPIIIEGIHALNERITSSIPKHQKFKIYISPQMQINIDNHSPLSTTDLRLIRRIVRDMKFRNYSPKTTINMWPSVRNGEFKWIYPNQEGADYVFNSELSYEQCIFKKYALKELEKIDIADSEYVTAQRLIRYLSLFESIEDESCIPCNSIIREFIGGSCFNVQ